MSGGGNAEFCVCDEIGPDGRPDLTLKFSRADLFAAIGPFEGSVELTLTGQLLDGTPIIARDCLTLPGEPVAPEGPKAPLISTLLP